MPPLLRRQSPSLELAVAPPLRPPRSAPHPLVFEEGHWLEASPRNPALSLGDRPAQARAMRLGDWGPAVPSRFCCLLGPDQYPKFTLIRE